MKRRRILISTLGLGLLLALTSGFNSTSSLSRAANPHHPLANFNSDNYADLAIGVPYETLEGPPTVEEAGAVSVLYGSALDGLSGADDQFWSQNSTDTEDTAEAYDHFGRALAAGDFDGDGYTDLAVGVPAQTVSGETNAGAVHVLYGSATGLSATDDQVWHQDTGTVHSLAEQNDYFGWTLTVGDFDGDGYDDLAVGAPFEDWNVQDAGIVQVLYGSAGGLTDAGNQLWRQEASGLPETEEIGDHFGESLATGDFNNDGYADLAIGVSDENFEYDPTLYDVGVVHILYGSADGLTATDNQLWHQDTTGVQDSPQQYDAFGSALTTGDFDGDGYDDLAVGVPGQVASTADYAGAVHMLYGGPTGLSAYGDRLLNQDELGIGAEDSDHFGSSLAASDFNGDGYDDLAVGVPDEDFGFDNIGSVDVLYGSTGGLSTTGIDVWIQGIGLEDEPEENDCFGEVLAAGDFNGDGYADLAVGVPNEDLEFVPETETNAGAVHVLYGSGDGLSSTGNQFWRQGAPVRDTAEEDDLFGFALAAIPSVRHRVYIPLTLRNYP